MSTSVTTPLTEDRLTLRARDGASATVLLHGGQLLSWQPAGGLGEQIYLSPLADLGGASAVRGGVPVIFPQFSDRGPAPGPRHGFARMRRWTCTEQGERAGHAYAVLRLEDDDSTRAVWNHAFALELTVSIGGRRLDLELAIANPADPDDAQARPFECTAALHTYLATPDVLKAQIEGLEGCSYEDNLTGQHRQQWTDVTSIVQATDRIYWSAPQPLLLRELGRRLRVGWSGFEDVVIWNPGPDGAAKLTDLPDDDWRHMLCIEAASIGNPIRVEPGEEWVGMQSFEL